MGDFYSSLFENLYGLDFSDYIWGTLSPVQDANLYMNFGMVMLISTLVFGIVYYFVLDRHSWSHWWCQLIAMMIPAVGNFIYGYSVLANQCNEGLMIDEKQNDLGFTSLDFANFGLANSLMAIIIFVGFTIIVKILFKLTPLQSDCSKAPLCK